MWFMHMGFDLVDLFDKCVYSLYKWWLSKVYCDENFGVLYFLTPNS